MKAILIIAATCIHFFANAQNNVSISQSITDNGTLTIRVNGNVNGKAIDYDKIFSVFGLNKTEREALKDKILDSLGVPNQRLKTSPRPLVTSGTIDLMNDDSVPSITSKNKYEQSYVVAGANPYTKEIKYNPGAGILFMRYRFTKKGVENTYERSIDAKDKTSEQREEIIRDYEKEIGLVLKD